MNFWCSARERLGLRSSLLVCVRGLNRRPSKRASKPWKQKPNLKPRLEVILMEDLHNYGLKGHIVRVRRGFGRNNLIPTGRAIYATPQNIMEHNAVEAPKDSAKRDASTFLTKFLDDKKLEIQCDCSEDDLFITEHDISRAFRKQLRVQVPLDRVFLNDPIKQFGSSMVTIGLDNGTELEVPLEVSVKCETENPSCSSASTDSSLV